MNRNLLLWKECLNSDGHQIHQDKQNEQPPLIFTLWTQQNTMTYDVDNPGPGLGQPQKINIPLNGIQTFTVTSS